MATWSSEARPVPVWGRDAARATLDEGASALLLDLASATFTVVETDDVEHLAAGHRLVRTTRARPGSPDFTRSHARWYSEALKWRSTSHLLGREIVG